MTDLDKAREEYNALTATKKDLALTSQWEVVGAADVLIAALEAEVEHQTKARKHHAKLEREAVLAYGKMSKRAEAAEAEVERLTKQYDGAIALIDHWQQRADEAEAAGNNCALELGVTKAKLAATEAQVARAEWKLKRLRDEGVIKDDDLASLEAVFVEFHREAQP